MDTNIGQYLSSIRNEKNLTLEEISEITKIKTRILEAIEDNKFDDLGGHGYAKALIVTYSKALGTDEKPVLKMFDESYTGIQLKYSRPLPDQDRKKYHFHMNFIYIVLLVVLIAVLAYFTIQLYKEGKLTSPIFKIFSGNKTETTEVLKDSLEIETDDPVEEPEISLLNQDALFDTINYTTDLLFEGKDSPLNYSE